MPTIGEERARLQDAINVAAKAKAAKSPNSEPTTPADEAEAALEELQEEYVDKVDVKPFSHDGVDYLKSSDGILYNPTSHDEVGVWSEALKTITPIEDDEESEDEEEDSEEDEESEDEEEDSEEEDDVVCA